MVRWCLVHWCTKHGFDGELRQELDGLELVFRNFLPLRHGFLEAFVSHAALEGAIDGVRQDFSEGTGHVVVGIARCSNCEEKDQARSSCLATSSDRFRVDLLHCYAWLRYKLRYLPSPHGNL